MVTLKIEFDELQLELIHRLAIQRKAEIEKQLALYPVDSRLRESIDDSDWSIADDIISDIETALANEIEQAK